MTDQTPHERLMQELVAVMAANTRTPLHEIKVTVAAADLDHELRAMRAKDSEREAMILPMVSDLNNIVRAIEDEGGREYFGSTNDADCLREIAQTLDAWRAALGTPDAENG